MLPFFIYFFFLILNASLTAPFPCTSHTHATSDTFPDQTKPLQHVSLYGLESAYASVSEGGREGGRGVVHPDGFFNTLFAGYISIKGEEEEREKKKKTISDLVQPETPPLLIINK